SINGNVDVVKTETNGTVNSEENETHESRTKDAKKNIQTVPSETPKEPETEVVRQKESIKCNVDVVKIEANGTVNSEENKSHETPTKDVKENIQTVTSEAPKEQETEVVGPKEWINGNVDVVKTETNGTVNSEESETHETPTKDVNEKIDNSEKSDSMTKVSNDFRLNSKTNNSGKEHYDRIEKENGFPTKKCDGSDDFSSETSSIEFKGDRSVISRVKHPIETKSKLAESTKYSNKDISKNLLNSVPDDQMKLKEIENFDKHQHNGNYKKIDASVIHSNPHRYGNVPKTVNKQKKVQNMDENLNQQTKVKKLQNGTKKIISNMNDSHNVSSAAHELSNNLDFSFSASPSSRSVSSIAHSSSVTSSPLTSFSFSNNSNGETICSNAKVNNMTVTSKISPYSCPPKDNYTSISTNSVYNDESFDDMKNQQCQTPSTSNSNYRKLDEVKKRSDNYTSFLKENHYTTPRYGVGDQSATIGSQLKRDSGDHRNHCFWTKYLYGSPMLSETTSSDEDNDDGVKKRSVSTDGLLFHDSEKEPLLSRVSKPSKIEDAFEAYDRQYWKLTPSTHTLNNTKKVQEILPLAAAIAHFEARADKSHEHFTRSRSPSRTSEKRRSIEDSPIMKRARETRKYPCRIPCLRFYIDDMKAQIKTMTERCDKHLNSMKSSMVYNEDTKLSNEIRAEKCAEKLVEKTI
ncbi:hypothetical protein SNEBB_008578, partial [Seison nebaliae]